MMSLQRLRGIVNWKHRAFLQRRSLWLIGALLVASAGAFGYHWAFGKAKVRYATAAVERGDVESTVVAAGIVQPIKYADVGAQTSGKLKSLKVNRSDQVEENQLLAAAFRHTLARSETRGSIFR